MGNTNYLAAICPCLDCLDCLRPHRGYQTIEDPAPVAEEALPLLPNHFSRLYRLGKQLGVGTTSRVFQVFRCTRRRHLTTHPHYHAMSRSHRKPRTRHGLTHHTHLSHKPHSPHKHPYSHHTTRAHSDSDSDSESESDTDSDDELSDSERERDSPTLACKIIDKQQLALSLGTEDTELVLFQLRKEMDILRRVHHPHIVRFLDYCETASQILIVTECLAGGELFDLIATQGPLRESDARKAFYGIFSAVAYLHDRGVIHRDIKAENVVLSRRVIDREKEGESPLAMKLIDFGFSTLSPFALTESFLGTGGYIAPEIRQSRSYSTAVDDWALGVLLYCSLCGKMPFDTSVDPLPTAQRDVQRFFRLRFPASLWGEISAEAKALISALLHIDPLQRMTAKNALRHPWFAEVAAEMEKNNQSLSSASESKHRRIALPHPSHSYRRFDSRKSRGEARHARQFLELPEIHSPLRRLRSTTPLEKRRTERARSTSCIRTESEQQREQEKERMIDRDKDIEREAEKEKESEEGAHTRTSSLSLSLSLSTPSLAFSRGLSSDDDTTAPQLTSSRCVSTMSCETITTAASTSHSSPSCSPPSDKRDSAVREGEGRDQSLRGSRSEKCIRMRYPPKHELLWDEVFHHVAGQLFFSTLTPNYVAQQRSPQFRS